MSKLEYIIDTNYIVSQGCFGSISPFYKAPAMKKRVTPQHLKQKKLKLMSNRSLDQKIYDNTHSQII